MNITTNFQTPIITAKSICTGKLVSSSKNNKTTQTVVLDTVSHDTLRALQSQVLTPSKTREDAIIEKALAALGLDKLTHTDPELMRQMLKDTRLDTFQTTYAPLQRQLEALKEKPQSLAPMLQLITHGLKQNPAMLDFIKKGTDEGWFQKDDHFKKAVHMAFLMETLTFATANSTAALSELNNYHLAERKADGFDSKNVLPLFLNLMRTYKSVFKPMKVLSVDPAVTYFRLIRENNGKPLTGTQLDALSREGKLTFIEKVILANNPDKSAEAKDIKISTLVQLNILEAGITEYNAGYKDNALVAYALKRGCENVPTEMKQGPVLPAGDSLKNHPADETDPANYHSVTAFSKTWTNLYTAWNAAFVVSHFDDQHKLLPKLFIPSQIDAKPEEYIFNRALTLSNAINFTIFNTIAGIPETPAPQNRREIAQAWGAINKAHALDYVEKELGIPREQFMTEFDAYFKNRITNFTRFAAGFLKQ